MIETSDNPSTTLDQAEKDRLTWTANRYVVSIIQTAQAIYRAIGFEHALWNRASQLSIDSRVLVEHRLLWLRWTGVRYSTERIAHIELRPPDSRLLNLHRGLFSSYLRVDGQVVLFGWHNRSTLPLDGAVMQTIIDGSTSHQLKELTIFLEDTNLGATKLLGHL